LLNDDLNTQFNTIFHHYFDRGDNLNCYVSFNFINFIKSSSEFPEIYDDANFLSKILEQVQFRFYLQNENATNIKEIKNISRYRIFPDQPIITFFLRHDVKQIKGNYQIRCLINFEDQFYKFINEVPPNEACVYFNLSEYQYSTIISDLKLIIEKKFINQFQPSNLAQTYEFYSDYIKIVDKSIKVSNLFDIYRNIITFEAYDNFIRQKELEKQYTYDSILPITKYIKDQKIYDLIFGLKTKTGNLNNYLDLSLSLLFNSLNRSDYKKTSSLENIFLENIVQTKPNKKAINPYDFISSLQSTACETSIFSALDIEKFKESDILYIATFLENYDFLRVDDFWTSDYKNMPVYLLDIATKYNVYYLSKINDDSMYETWEPLTKESLNLLNNGRYLCMISADKDYINNEIIENYFILEK
jgi:hypothetical protein